MRSYHLRESLGGNLIFMKIKLEKTYNDGATKEHTCQYIASEDYVQNGRLTILQSRVRMKIK